MGLFASIFLGIIFAVLSGAAAFILGVRHCHYNPLSFGLDHILAATIVCASLGGGIGGVCGYIA